MASTDLTVPTWESFAEEMNAPGRDWVALLPPTVNQDRFRACAITAVKQNPDLLRCTARSLFNAISRAAQDGMMPDGREGFINSYNTKIGKDEKGRDVYGLVAQWQPMAYGMRKRARELDNIIIDAQVVYQNDHFIWHQGDNPSIEHTPAEMKRDRDPGQIVGAYAIFRKDGAILHREVMDYGQVEKTRSKSKAPDSLMWKDFTGEGYKKTAVRRGIKTVPVSEAMAEIIKRDDEESFDLDGREDHHDIVTPPRPRESEFARKPTPRVEEKPMPQTLDMGGGQKREPEMAQRVAAQESSDVIREQAERARGEAEMVTDAKDDAASGAAAREDERQDFIKAAYAELAACQKVRDIPAIEEEFKAPGVMTEAEETKWVADCDARGKAIMAAAKAGKR